MLNAQKTHQLLILSCAAALNYANVWHGDSVTSQSHRIEGRTTDEVFQEQCFPWERGASVGEVLDIWHTHLSPNKPPLLQWTVDPQSKWHLDRCAPFPFSSSSLLTSTWDFSPSRHMWGQHNPVASVESTLSLPTESTSVESDPSLSVPCPSFNLLPSGLL